MADETFEQQIAVTLMQLICAAENEGDLSQASEDAIKVLAPRVAAAITAAGEGGANDILGAGPGAQDLGLAALRGTDA